MAPCEGRGRAPPAPEGLHSELLAVLDEASEWALWGIQRWTGAAADVQRARLEAGVRPWAHAALADALRHAAALADLLQARASPLLQGAGAALRGREGLAAELDRAVADSNRLIAKMSSTISVFANYFAPEKEKHAFSALAQLRETLALLEATFKSAGIAVEVEAQADVFLFGYSNEYAQVLLNLLSNARQAIEGSRVTPGRVTLRIEERDGLGCLTVRDNGGGIPAEVLDRVFDPYFSTKPGGTGIGLYLSRQLAEKSLGGRLEVRNVEGGAEFALLTPLYKG